MTVILYCIFYNWSQKQSKKVVQAGNEIMEYIKENVEEHKKGYNGDNVRDLIDIYLKHNPDQGKN